MVVCMSGQRSRSKTSSTLMVCELRVDGTTNKWMAWKKNKEKMLPVQNLREVPWYPWHCSLREHSTGFLSVRLTSAPNLTCHTTGNQPTLHQSFILYICTESLLHNKKKNIFTFLSTPTNHSHAQPQSIPKLHWKKSGWAVEQSKICTFSRI